jgi:hypothetical protein
MQVSNRKGFIDRESYVAQYLALAVFTIGVTSTIGSDDLLAAFAAGMLYFLQLYMALIERQVMPFLGMGISENRRKTIHSPPF